MDERKRMPEAGIEFEKRTPKTVSWVLSLLLLFATLLSSLFLTSTTSAGGLVLNHANVVFTIEDNGIITGGIVWPWFSQPQTDIVNNSYLTVYHDAYPSGGGNFDVASGYGFGTGDFTVVEENTWIQLDTFQETYSSFTQTGVSGVSNDLNIYQRAFAKRGEDWAIVMWKLVNIYGQDIHDLRVGMNFQTRIGNTPGDDIDYWNAADSIYYIEDGPTGSVLMGLASADPTLPVNHYYGNPSGLAGVVDPSDDKSLYESLMMNKVHGSQDDVTCMVGWEVGTLPAGSNVSLPLTIAFGTTYQDLTAAVDRAKGFLVSQKRWLMITEIQDFSSSDNAKVEIYNGWEKTFLTSDIYLSPDGLTSWTSGVWDKSSVSPFEYSVYSLGPGESFPSLEGGTISLHEQNGFILDSVSYGQSGPAPDPLRDESIARYWTGGLESDFWGRDPTPTFGVANDGMGILEDPPIALNEVYFNANSSDDRFVEIYYFGPDSADISGWTLVVDSEYFLPALTLNVSKRFFVLRAEDFPADFDMDDGTLNGDNVYLYDELGRLADRVGWSSAHTEGLSMDRIGDYLSWGYDGFNDSSSNMAGWRFNVSPSSQAVLLKPDRQEMVYPGLTAQYSISLGYLGSCADTFDISDISTPDWETRITDPLGDPLLDHDGDTLPDSDLMLHGDTLDMKVEVVVPLGSEAWDMNIVYVTATSSVNANLSSTVMLRTIAVLSPYILANESAEPDTIWPEGSPLFPQETTITLNVTGLGPTLGWYVAHDTVFVIDNSGSMDGNDPANLRVAGAKAYVDMMRIPDRAATVLFAHYAELYRGHHLTSNHTQVKDDLDSWPPAVGGTNITSGLVTAVDELMYYGHPHNAKVAILLTDGDQWIEEDSRTIQTARMAAKEGIIVFTIGLGQFADEVLLGEIANVTGGRYYYAPTAEALEDIYLTIYQSLEPEGIAGKRIEDPIEPNPMVRDILPPHIHYVPTSFRDQDYKPCPPDVITLRPDGSTELDWDVEKILVNQSWIVSFKVTSSLSGHIPVGVYPLSRVNYSEWDNSNETVPFPEVFINVLSLEPMDPPILTIETDQDNIRLSWTVPAPKNIRHYLIYRSTDQREFDFSSPYIDTSVNWDNGIVLNRTSWNDTGAASLVPREYYYVVRAVTNLGLKSPTSNTVGKWTKSFESGMNTFSLPLEPITEHDIEWYARSIPNTVYVDWIDATGHWTRQRKDEPLTRTDPLRVGESFEIYLSSPSTFTFVGSPASVIRFQDGFGDSLDFRRGLSTAVSADDFSLYWNTAEGASGYKVYRSDSRPGFHTRTGLSVVYNNTGTFFKDKGVLSQPGNWYYMVVPYYEGGVEGSSTYSVGVITIEYQSGSDTFALPLKTEEVHSLDWFCDQIPRVVGVAYLTSEVWKFHATQMPEGVYDIEVLQSEGYQISVDGGTTKSIFIGY